MSNKQECTFTSVAPYPKVRQLAHGLKDGDYASICKAAEMMADGIRVMAAGRNCVLVPIPNHRGRAIYTKTLANEISRRTGIPTWDILSCRPHMPLHYAKKNDLKPEGIYLKLNLYRTMLAVLGHTKNHLTNKNYQFNQIATNMEKKMQEQTSDKKQVKNKTDTPLAVYQRLKSKHPDALILMRNGDFYRSLNEDAQKVSDTLRIPTQKPKAKGEGELMAEFPHHALDVYLPRLIRAGNRVAIADMQELSKKQTTNQTKNQTQTDAMEKKTEKKKTKAKDAKVDNTEMKAETKKEDKAVEKSAEQSTGQKVHKPREPQMVTVNGEKVSHGHAFQSNQDPNKWYFTARLDGQQLRPQLMKPEDVAAYQKREIGVEALMQTYYPTKLAKKVTPEEYKADNKLSDGRVIEKMVVYKEHYFDRVTTPSKLVEKNFGEQLHLASFYNQFKLEEGVKDVRIAKSQQGDWTVSADLGEKGVTSKAVLSWHDKQSLFTMKTATKEQLAARYLNTEIKSMVAEKQTQRAAMKV